MFAMRFLRYIALLLMFLGTGCTTPTETITLIEQSERVAIDYPDSALMLIESVDSKQIRGKRDKAHYRLALCEALYYNYIDSDCDSLTRPLYDYYLHSNRHNERARAMYQHGLVKTNSRDYSEAILSFLEAEKSLQLCDNPRLLGLVYRSLGDIYHLQYICDEAITTYTKAIACFNEANLQYHSLYTMYEIGRVYSVLRKFDLSIETLIHAEKIAAEHNYDTLRYLIISSICMSYIQINDFASCQKWFELLDVDENDDFGLHQYYAIKTILDAHNGDFKDAYESLELTKIYAPEAKTYVMYAELQLLTYQGYTEQAFEAYKQMIRFQDQSFLTLIESSSSHDQLNYVENNMQLLSKLHHRSKIIFYLALVVCIVALLFIIYIFITKSREKQERINTLSNQIESVKQELSNQNRHTKRLSNIAAESECKMIAMKRKLNENIRISLHNIDDLLGAYYTDNTKRVKQNQIIEAIDKYVLEFASNKNGYLAVEEYVNEYRNNIMKILRDEMPSLSEDEYMLLCLTYADFSSNAICMFMGYDKNKLYKHKSRLRAKIADSNCKSKSLLLQFL